MYLYFTIIIYLILSGLVYSVTLYTLYFELL